MKKTSIIIRNGKYSLLSIILLILQLTIVYGGDNRKPNVIIVLTDDQGYGDMSCHGNPYLNTPELDRLSREGVRLTDFHVDPTCSPTRAALVSGRYASRVGVWLTYGSRNHLRRDELTIGDVFKQNGYRTAVFGKWHLGDNFPFRPGDRGFDESLVHGGGVIGETPDYWDNNYYDDIYFRNGKPEKVEGYCTDVWFREAKRFIRENSDEPFLVYLPTNAAHAPFHVPESYAEPYKEGSGGRSAFYGMISNIDENIGRLRDYLDELSLDRETIFIFLNDNGTAGGVSLEGGKDKWDGWEASGYNAGMRGRKGSPYEGGHRAACFIYWPEGGLTGGKDVGGLTAHIDLLPTLVDLCELEIDSEPDFDGISLRKAMKNGKTSRKRTLFVHNQARFGTEIGEAPLIKFKDYSVMRDKWRLVGKELYDISEDPGQRVDLASQYPKVVSELNEAYEEWWNSISENEGAFCPFVINPSKQETVLISSQNLLGGNVAYNQRHVRGAEPVNGWTYVEVETAGRYKISLRRWPRESELGIHDIAAPYPMEEGKHRMKNQPTVAVKAVEARLAIGSYDKTRVVKSGEEEVSFSVDLPKGLQRIQTWFKLENEDSITAYYTYIEALNEDIPDEYEAQKQPNIILFFVDDLGWSSLGYRNPNVFETPNIDMLAFEGLDFQQMYIPSPTCSPSRSTLLTGKHPARLKIVRHITDNTKSASMVYDKDGRNTHHLWLTDPAQFPSKQWLDLEHVSYAEALHEQGYYNLFLGKWHLGPKEYHPIHQGFDHQIGTTDQGSPSNYYPDYFKNEDVLEEVEDRYLTDLLTDSIVDFIDNYEKEQPFMLSYWSYNVHTPHIGRKDLLEYFESKGLEGRHAHLSAMVRSVDMSLGRIRRALDENGIDKNTIIIFLSDQGGYFDNPPFHGGKRFDTLYEGGARVPFIVYWPGVTDAGSINESVVQSTDLFPTLVDIAGGNPADYYDLDGVSLYDVIRDNSILQRGEPIYGYRAYEDLYASVRDGNWKLLAYRSGLLKLYNIANDIREEHDLIQVEKEKAEELKNQLISWEIEMGVEQYSGVQ